MKRLLCACLLAIGGIVGSSATLANTFKLQSAGIILNEAEGEAIFNVQNTGQAPILLLSTLENLKDDDTADRILVSPPVTRIEPGDTQMVRFTLKQGEPLGEERLVKAAFEGVPQGEDNQLRVTVRQEIGFLVQPKRVAVVARPWDDLRWKVEGNELVVSNPGKHIVRLGPQVQVHPSGDYAQQGQMYVRPGETLRTKLPEGTTAVDKVTIVPLSRYGFAMPESDITPESA